MSRITPTPGMVLAVHTPDNFTDDMIRLGSALIGEPNIANHIAVIDHRDSKGTWWALEGRPGGVGWRDATSYLASGYTISNQGQMQAASVAQASSVCFWMRKLINTGYDWDAIVGDAQRDLHLPVLPDPWAERDVNGEVKGHVVCSSAAVFAYIKGILKYPTYSDMAHTEPSDWVKFILDNNYA